jgi:molecular chaperone DnaK
VETRNQAEALTFQAERTLKDLGDKVSAEDRAETERRIEAVRAALKGDDASAIETSVTALAEVLQRVSTAAYQAAAAGAGADGESGAGASGDGAAPGGPGSGASEGGAPEGEETVEGEFKEV